MINVILSHDSALRFWSKHSATISEQTLSKTAIKNAVQSTRGTLQAEALQTVLNCSWLIYYPRPIDLLVGDERDRRVTDLAHFHLQSSALPRGALTLTDGAIIRAGAKQNTYSILAASPELTFVQMSQHMKLPELIELGYELCGFYAIEPESEKGFIERSPVTDPKKLTDFCEHASRIKGIKKARRAAKHVLANSRSPKESQIAMLASLPRRMGGFGLQEPILNATIQVPPNVARVLESRKCIPDFYWPSIKTVVEYDSNLEHLDRTTHDHDARKRNAYAMMGIELRSITARQLYDFGTIANILRDLREKQRVSTGKRRVATTREQLYKQEKLHRWLMHGERRKR